ncbi:alpha/beta fold hydrolase [Paenibacillus radicis (ex Xue et al. 2023)]|uniref:Alpha/beta hydrolase n=1 Tax=Paenibacillus radicis (ex Xue et al. 2023) TaxID=2972489 RepID=A0ABT1YNB1_9BACL|nr:alpha/beta hydrolase [Paenibacillus radicis (ex Xue et al. 2023)]MCR8634220.1 alpha/beta hydrolase [Paenibacillus radicis (ex Xue et al. 2023)]
MIKMVKLMNGSEIEVRLAGNPDRKTIMLPIAKKTVYGEEAEKLNMWGVDPELGEHFVEGLADIFQVLYFDYEGHLLAYPNPDHLTPEQVVKDLLRIADEMQIRSFSYYGYSWLALVGLQLAIRTDRLESLIMGGYPPYNGPYLEMMTVTNKAYEQALQNEQNTVTSHQPSENPEAFDWDNITVKIDPRVAKQFMTLYQNLMGFDDRSIQDRLQLPKFAFAGEKDTIVYGENFGSVTVDIVGLLERNENQLNELEWDVEILKGNDMDHTKAMQPATVLPLIKPWLIEKLLRDDRE